MKKILAGILSLFLLSQNCYAGITSYGDFKVHNSTADDLKISWDDTGTNKIMNIKPTVTDDLVLAFGAVSPELQP